jgi:hypothetical protein
LAQVWINILKENQVLLSLANYFVKMLIFNRLHRARVVSQLSTWIASQFGQILVKQYLIHVHMERWRLALLEFNLIQLTG